ncbi:hypothetical protein Tco_0010042 [Tanacetum coccineum]
MRYHNRSIGHHDQSFPVKNRILESVNPTNPPKGFGGRELRTTFRLDMARSLASERVGFGTQSLLEQWRDSYGNGDYDEDPYDDDMYEGQVLPQEI